MNKTVTRNKTEGLLDFPLFVLDWDGGIGTIDNSELSWEAWHESRGLRWQWCNSSGDGQAQVQGFREEECQWGWEDVPGEVTLGRTVES